MQGSNGLGGQGGINGLRNQFIQGVRPVAPIAENMVGQAFTLRYIPAREDRNPLEVFRNPDHPQRVAIETCPPGQVLVMDGRKDAYAASAGSILVTRLAVRGGAGIVSDAGFRDMQGIGELDMPAYCTGPSAPTNLTKHEALDIDVPIACGDVAGCPVVVKGHSAHPGTGEIVAEAIHAAIKSCNLHPGVFSLIQGGRRDVGTALVTHPLIRAVGFTGSLAGGRALFDLCAQRPEPIPFFGELGSVNPMFILPGACSNRGAEIGAGWAASLTMGAGQFCTNPGIAVVETGAAGDAFVAAARAGLADTGAQVMLTDGIAQAYRDGQARFEGRNAVRPLLSTDSAGREANPNLYETEAAAYLQDHALGEEVFGPLGLVVRVTGADEMQTLAKGFEGQLTATIHMDEDDTGQARALLPILERKAGRVLVNGFPTGVEVADSMVHGGPYPASTNFGATSVGTLSIRRFLRPVCYQNAPDAILPNDLVDG